MVSTIEVHWWLTDTWNPISFETTWMEIYWIELKLISIMPASVLYKNMISTWIILAKGEKSRIFFLLFQTNIGLGSSGVIIFLGIPDDKTNQT